MKTKQRPAEAGRDWQNFEPPWQNFEPDWQNFEPDWTPPVFDLDVDPWEGEPPVFDLDIDPWCCTLPSPDAPPPFLWQNRQINPVYYRKPPGQ